MSVIGKSSFSSSSSAFATQRELNGPASGMRTPAPPHARLFQSCTNSSACASIACGGGSGTGRCRSASASSSSDPSRRPQAAACVARAETAFRIEPQHIVPDIRVGARGNLLKVRLDEPGHRRSVSGGIGAGPRDEFFGELERRVSLLRLHGRINMWKSTVLQDRCDGDLQGRLDGAFTPCLSPSCSPPAHKKSGPPGGGPPVSPREGGDDRYGRSEVDVEAGHEGGAFRRRVRCPRRTKIDVFHDTPGASL